MTFAIQLSLSTLFSKLCLLLLCDFLESSLWSVWGEFDTG